MSVPIIVAAEARKRAVAVVDISIHVEVAIQTYGSVILELDEATRAVY
jgi:hypothetical protein